MITKREMKQYKKAWDQCYKKLVKGTVVFPKKGLKVIPFYDYGTVAFRDLAGMYHRAKRNLLFILKKRPESL